MDLTPPQRIGDPIQRRAREAENRRGAVDQVNNAVNEIVAFVTSAVRRGGGGCMTRQDPKWEHVAADERAKAMVEASSLQGWLQERLDAQKARPKHADPAFLCDEAIKKRDVRGGGWRCSF
jgi:hypothetical protein